MPSIVCLAKNTLPQEQMNIVLPQKEGPGFSHKTASTCEDLVLQLSRISQSLKNPSLTLTRRGKIF